MATVAKNNRSTTSTIAVSSAGPFNVDFRLFDDDALNVYVNDIERADYTISSTYVNGYDDTATITFTSALEVSDTLRIEGWLSPGRAEDLVNGDGSLVAKMNVELARIWSSLIEVQREAARSLRSFTELAPAAGIDLETVAGAEAFATAAAASASAAATSAAAALAAENSLLEWAGAWLTATAYEPSDIVQESGNAYICVTAHTSGTFATDLAAGRWALFVSKGASGAGSGDLLAANNLSDVDDAAASRANIGAQANNATLTSLAGISLAAGDTLYATAANTLVRLAKGSAGEVLTMNGAGTLPEWAASPLGVDQTYQDVTSSRTEGTWYQNTTGRPILVVLRWRSSNSTDREFQTSPDTSAITTIAKSNQSAGSPETLNVIIPNDLYYRVNAALSVKLWVELR